MSDNPAVQHKIDTASGHIHYVKSGSGPALVALHGMAASSWSWSRSLPELAKSFTVYAPDLIGHGQSEARRDVVSVEHHAVAIAAFLEAARIEHCILAGTALGGLIAMELALLEPATIKGVLLLGVPNFADHQARSAWLASRALTFVDEHGLGIPMEEHAVRERYRVFTPSLVAEVNTERDRAGLWALHDVWAIASYDAAAAASRLSQPAIFCFGDHDPFLGGRPGLVAAAPKATHLVLEGVGHYPAWDAPRKRSNLLSKFPASGKSKAS